MPETEKSIEEGIPSPIKNIVVTPEILEKIKEMTGSTCVFVAVSDEQVHAQCDPDKCTGHYVNINNVGFVPHQIFSLVAMLAKQFGYELTEIGDEE